MINEMHPEYIGRPVLGRSDTGEIEKGVIVNFTKSYVFVRFGDSALSNARRPRELEWDICGIPVRCDATL